MKLNPNSVHFCNGRNAVAPRLFTICGILQAKTRKLLISIVAATCLAVPGIMPANCDDTPVNPIVGAEWVSVDIAKAWAIRNEAADRFVDIADLYWYYGELTGIRPEVLYAQAAKETNFGKYTGKVIPQMNNWAGIKILSPSGDQTYDHQTFDTPEDGVRAHFNHMSAYVGFQPIGIPHDRYHVVMRLDWAGTVTSVEQLGGKWAPSPLYGEEIVNNLLRSMLNTAPSDAISIADGEG